MAYCSQCGSQMSPLAPACPQCGHPTARAQTTTAKRPDAFAIASLACAVASFIVIPIVGSILGVIFGRIALDRIAANPELGGEEMARAGVIVGWVGIALIGAVLVVVLMFVAAFTP